MTGPAISRRDFLTVRELYKASDPRRGSIDWKSRPTHPLLGFWWAAWLGWDVLVNVGNAIAAQDRVSLPGPEIAQSGILIGANAALAAAAVLAIVLVRWIDRDQTAKRTEHASWTPAISLLGLVIRNPIILKRLRWMRLGVITSGFHFRNWSALTIEVPSITT